MVGLIGREQELLLLKKAYKSNRAELGIVYGRRRVGKSTLLTHFTNTNHLFLEGVRGLSKTKQIRHFVTQIAEQTQTVPANATTWPEALQVLTQFIGKGRWYVVIDELPWMASGRQELVAYIKYYWDNHWKKNHQLHMVLCGSIASFMVKHVVHSQALHNRKTYEIKLDPLLIHEVKPFFPGVPRDQMLKYMMTFGGIPKYLEQIDPHESYDKNIDRLCLNRNGFFHGEFETIFKEQFKTTKIYEKIVSLLSQKSVNKENLSGELGLSSGGGLSTYFEHLEMADFVRNFHSFDFQSQDREKTRRYVLWDEWLRFYFAFIKPHLKIIDLNSNKKLYKTLVQPKIDAYMGLGFERLVIKNLPSLLEKLDLELAAIKSYGPYFQTAKKLEGVQFDLIIEERDQTLILVECKNSVQPIGLGVAREFEEKIKKLNPPSRYLIKKVLVTGGAVSEDLRKKKYFSQIVTAADLLGF